ncbi:hypothetical protein L0F63_004565, partial [Massospora cicadina]
AELPDPGHIPLHWFLFPPADEDEADVYLKIMLTQEEILPKFVGHLASWRAPFRDIMGQLQWGVERSQGPSHNKAAQLPGKQLWSPSASDLINQLNSCLLA